MHEEATVRNTSPFHTIDFATVSMGDDWMPHHTVEIADEDGATSQLRVHPGVSAALRRAALLQPSGLCSRLRVDVHEGGEHIGLEIVGVYWEG
jgi:precorrin-3B methylase